MGQTEALWTIGALDCLRRVKGSGRERIFFKRYCLSWCQTFYVNLSIVFATMCICINLVDNSFTSPVCAGTGRGPSYHTSHELVSSQRYPQIPSQYLAKEAPTPSPSQSLSAQPSQPRRITRSRPLKAMTQTHGLTSSNLFSPDGPDDKIVSQPLLLLPHPIGIS